MVAMIHQTLASADKVHLVNLIATLKSELKTTNELMHIKNEEYKAVIVRLKCGADQLRAAQKRIELLESKTVRIAHE